MTFTPRGIHGRSIVAARDHQHRESDSITETTTFDTGTYIGNAVVALTRGRTIASYPARYLDIHQEPDGSVVLFSRTDPDPGDGGNDTGEVVNAMSIPAKMAADVLAIFGAA